MTKASGSARIEYLKVRNFRALRDIEFKDLTPLTVLLGPNGSGKSTVFDVFAFLSECFDSGLRRAWDARGRAKELKTRGAEGPLEIEIRYREPGYPLITYHLSVDEIDGRPVVVDEWLRWKRGSHGAPFRFLEFRHGVGRAISGELPDAEDERVDTTLSSPDLLAVSALGQFEQHPRAAALKSYVTGWYVSYLSADSARGQPIAGPQEKLSRSGDNLANVVQYLAERYPDRLQRVFAALAERVPQVEKVFAETMTDGRLLLQIKDGPFEKPVLARFASDSTLKLLAYLVLLHDPEPAPFIGIEEPENFLHPRLLRDLGEECRAASGHTQMLVTTHSPYFLDALRPREVHVLARDSTGYANVRRVADIQGVSAYVEHGALLGSLWMEGHFGAADVPAGRSASAMGAESAP